MTEATGSYDAGPVPERHSDAEIDAAIEALSDPQRLEEAQRLVAAKAPQLQRILDQALEPAAGSVATRPRCSRPPAARIPRSASPPCATLVAEETRLSMLVGVAVGYELAQILTRGDT